MEAQPRPIPGGAQFAQTVTDIEPPLTWMLSALDWLSDTLADPLEEGPPPGRARGPESRALP